jgi:purine-binding chemotaxis protein CheW
MEEKHNLLKNNVKQLCGFKVGNDNFAFSVLQVQEVIRELEVTPIPLAPSYIKGLMNLRGQIVTSISLRELFGLKDEKLEGRMNIIVQFADDLYAIEVDEISDVLEVEETIFEPTPENITMSMRQFISGVYKLKEYLLIVLDIDKLITERNV